MQTDLFQTAGVNVIEKGSQPRSRGGSAGANENASRVGARHGSTPFVPQGGGYPPSCNASEVAFGGVAAAAAPAGVTAANDDRDPRIEELRRLGLNVVWVRIAEAIGFDAWLVVWRTMSISRDFMDKRNRVTIPDIALFFEYQRHQEIRALGLQGHTWRQIQQRMLETTGQKLTKFQIEHVLRQLRASASRNSG